MVGSGPLRLLHGLTAVPYWAAGSFPRRDVRHRAARLALPEYRIAHRIEEPAGLLLFKATVGLHLLYARICPLQRFILKQHGLHQVLNRVRRLAQTFTDGVHGVRI